MSRYWLIFLHECALESGQLPYESSAIEILSDTLCSKQQCIVVSRTI